MKLTCVFGFLILLLSCGKSATNGMMTTEPFKITNPGNQLSYLALGDSYTIGESVAQNQSFPYQLAALLEEQGVKVAGPKIIAKTGWTTGELKQGIQAEALTGRYDIVTLLIGVNNQYRGDSIDTYRTEFKELLKAAVGFANDDKTHVFVVSIPDWGATPFGLQSGRGTEIIAKQIDAFNAVNKEEALKAGINYTDITPGSRNATVDFTLVASDGLHPSALMYREWALHLLPAVLKVYK